MSETDQTNGWICIRRAHARSSLTDASLVLSAVDIEHHLAGDGVDWGLFVSPTAVAHAERELAAFSTENRIRQAPRPTIAVIDRGWMGVVGYLMVIWLLPTLESAFPFARDWRESGAMEAGLVMDGQWWRTITALTLHADLAHIAANSLFGAVFGVLVGRHLGSGFGWLLVVLCGALGNGLNAVVQPDAAFRSIGASTATFAALGLVGGFVWRRGYYRGSNWRRSAAPIFAAIALFAYTGIGDANTDVVGHLMGMLTGLAAGIFIAPYSIRWLGVTGQRAGGVLALGLVALAWWCAS